MGNSIRINMTPEKRLEILDDFLRKHCIYDSYYSNTAKCNSSLNVDVHSFILGICADSDDNPFRLFHSAFVWGDTPEGHTFWNDICDKWTAKFK